MEKGTGESDSTFKKGGFSIKKASDKEEESKEKPKRVHEGSVGNTYEKEKTTEKGDEEESDEPTEEER